MTETRTALTRERVLRAAIALADEGGIAAVTMRRMAENLGAEAMSLYYHVSNKEDVLDGMVELLGQEINEITSRISGTPDAQGWRAVARQRILAAREVLLRHRWAPGVLATRTSISPSVAKYHDGLIGLMRSDGVSFDLIHHGLHALGSRALGFAQELFDPGNGPVDESVITAMAPELPNIAAMLAEVAHDDPESTLGWCDDQTEFEFSLDLILEGIEARARAA
ncbi:TetR/AcrR family transcriptional regulator [Longispora albida]|uniref:TetR/AcrR family transcriptional regulator n=1 Tax=Longispora albida TaxID=203523 RepID=UPI00039CE166|nr:TetR/AcrR family transcriptional regulator C-terminal domain-containing protein [Longispora albida]